MSEQEKYKVRLIGAQATLLLTLSAKAADFRSKRSLLHDATAAQILDSIEVDADAFKEPRSDDLIVVRARQYDEWVRAFIAAHQNAVVVYLGAGLDTRVTRIDPPSTVSWFDVDFPDVIEFRKHFYTEREGYRLIPSSITDPAWLGSIPSDRPAMIIAEGCLEYLAKDDVKNLFNHLTDHFASGQIASDIMNTTGVEFAREIVKAMGTAHLWVVDDIQDADALNPKLKRRATIPVSTSSFVKKLGLRQRAFFKFMSLFPQYRDTMRLVLYEF